MTEARRIEQLEATLAELERRTRDRALLAAGALAVALIATRASPDLAWPLAAGGLCVAFLGIATYVRRRELIEALARDPDAYVIPDVRRFGEQLARPRVRHELALSIRLALEDPLVGKQVELCRAELEELVGELDSPDWAIEPAAAVACRELVVGSRGPLYDSTVPPELARSKVRQILAGLHPAGKPQAGSARPPMAA